MRQFAKVVLHKSLDDLLLLLLLRTRDLNEVAELTRLLEQVVDVLEVVVDDVQRLRFNFSTSAVEAAAKSAPA